MEGAKRGGPTPSCADDRFHQQLSRSRRTAPPPPTFQVRADGHPRGTMTATPPASRAVGGGNGLTVQQQRQQQQQKQQQQQTTVAPPSPLARHALALYRQCVAAGQWARVVFEQHPTGESISFFSRPMAAAPAAARETGKPRKQRRPNQKRRDKKALWKRARDQRQAAASGQQLRGRADRQRQPAPASSQQLQQAPVRAAAAARTRQPAAASSHSPQQQQQTAHRTWAAMPAASATAIRLVSTVQSSPVISPSLYRASSDSEVFSQLDGAVTSPQSSPDQQPGGVPESPPSPSSEPSPLSSEKAPLPTTPPPPPPLPCSVLCRFCEIIEHSEDFFMCAGCHWESHNEPYLNCPDCEELRLESVHQASHSSPLFDCPECECIRSIIRV